MNYVKNIFNILGISPNEKFYIKGLKQHGTFTIDEKLNLINELAKGLVSIKDLLNGDYEIIKYLQWQQDEELVMKFCCKNGYPYIAKDDNNEIYAFKNKPVNVCDIGYLSEDDFFPINIDMPHIVPGQCIDTKDILKME